MNFYTVRDLRTTPKSIWENLVADGEVVITANPSDASKVKDVLESHISNIDYTLDEIGWYAKEMVTLEGEDKEVFERLLSLLEDIEDVTNIYHNVNL